MISASSIISIITGVFLLITSAYLTYTYRTAELAVKEAAQRLSLTQNVEHTLGLYRGGRNLGIGFGALGLLILCSGVVMLFIQPKWVLETTIVAVDCVLFVISLYGVHRATSLQDTFGES